jgi:hypothetical protein
MVGFGLFDRPLGSRALEVKASWPGEAQRLRGANEQAICRGNGADFQVLDTSPRGMSWVLIFGALSSKKKKCGQ